MNMTGLLTTIAIKFEDGDKIRWALESYIRLVTNSVDDIHFIEGFKMDYLGNGIIDVKVIESRELGYYDLTDIANGAVYSDVDKILDDYNHTILDY